MRGPLRGEMSNENLLSRHLPSQLCSVISKGISQTTCVFGPKILGRIFFFEFTPMKHPRFLSYVYTLHHDAAPQVSASPVCAHVSMFLPHRSSRGLYCRCRGAQRHRAALAGSFSPGFLRRVPARARPGSCK